MCIIFVYPQALPGAFVSFEESVYKFLIEVDHLIFKFRSIVPDYDSMQIVVADIQHEIDISVVKMDLFEPILVNHTVWLYNTIDFNRIPGIGILYILEK